MREFDQEGTPADADALLQEHLVRGGGEAAADALAVGSWGF